MDLVTYLGLGAVRRCNLLYTYQRKSVSRSPKAQVHSVVNREAYIVLGRTYPETLQVYCFCRARINNDGDIFVVVQTSSTRTRRI